MQTALDNAIIAAPRSEYAAIIGNGVNTTFALSHNLDTQDVSVTVYQVSDGVEVDCDIARTSVNVVTLTFASAPASNSLRCLVARSAQGLSAFTGSQTLTDKTLIRPKIDTVKDTNGNTILGLTPVTSATNYINIWNDTGGPTIGALGSSTNISILFQPKGSGAVHIWAGTGQTPSLVANGADTSHNLNLQSKGSGLVTLNGVAAVDISSAQSLTNKTLSSPTITGPKIDTIKDANGNTALALQAIASAVNYLRVSNASNASPTVGLAAYGSSTDITLALTPKGGGRVQLWGDTSQVAMSLSAASSATDVSLDLVTKGTGTVKANGVDVVTTTGTQSLSNKTLTSPTINTPKIDTIKDTTNNLSALAISAPASAVNYVSVSGSATGNKVAVGATGSDTDVSLNLTTKNAGTVQANGNPVGVKVSVPSTASSTGVPGQWAADSSYMYVCTATNTWLRAAIATW